MSVSSIFKTLIIFSFSFLLISCGGSGGDAKEEATAIINDLDQDGISDETDTDIDGDGVENTNDAFPLDATETLDTDLDGIGDNSDTDIDGDKVLNADDAFPLDATESLDTDLDGIGDNTDLDIDGDTVPNADDGFPLDPNESGLALSMLLLEKYLNNALYTCLINNREINNIDTSIVVNEVPLSDFKILSCQTSKLVELSQLAHLNNLEELYLSNSQVTDLSVLASLNKLRVLELSKIPAIDFSIISELVSLQTLLLNDVAINSLEFLTNLTTLKTLSLKKINLQNIEALATLTDLESLTLSHNELTDISDVSLFTKLQHLHLDFNKIEILTDFALIPSLETLVLNNNHLSDISALEPLTSLGYLKLSNNQINNVSTIIAWETLPDYLSLQGNDLSCEDDRNIANKVIDSVYLGVFDCNGIFLGDSIATDGPFGVGDPNAENYLPAKQIQDVFYLDDTNIGRDGHWDFVGITEMYACQKDVHVCWVANGPVANNFDCIAEKDSTYATCSAPATESFGYPGHAFTLDFQEELLPNNAFATTFNDRLITTLFKAYTTVTDVSDAYRTINAVSCEYNNQDDMYDCVLAFDNVTGPEVSWQQDHEHERLPRCSAAAFDTIATCTPAWSVIFDESTQTSPSFDIDLSEYQITPHPRGDGSFGINSEKSL